MKPNPFRLAAVLVVCLYAVAILVTWIRKHQFDFDLIFWMGMSVVLLSGMSLAKPKGD